MVEGPLRTLGRGHQPPPSVRTVAIPFADLKERGKDLSGKIEEGLGPNGLGIISISDVPDFPALRRTLLRLAPRYVPLISLQDSAPKCMNTQGEGSRPRQESADENDAAERKDSCNCKLFCCCRCIGNCSAAAAAL